MWCNCYVYAWRKRRREGGAIVLIPSRRGWWFHGQHLSADCTTISEFVPDYPRNWLPVPPPWFRGHEESRPFTDRRIRERRSRPRYTRNRRRPTPSV